MTKFAEPPSRWTRLAGLLRPRRRGHVAAIVGGTRGLGLDLNRFERDLTSHETAERVESDIADGRRNGVTGTPTIFVDGLRRK